MPSSYSHKLSKQAKSIEHVDDPLPTIHWTLYLSNLNHVVQRFVDDWKSIKYYLLKNVIIIIIIMMVITLTMITICTENKFKQII